MSWVKSPKHPLEAEISSRIVGNPEAERSLPGGPPLSGTTRTRALDERIGDLALTDPRGPIPPKPCELGLLSTIPIVISNCVIASAQGVVAKFNTEVLSRSCVHTSEDSGVNYSQTG